MSPPNVETLASEGINIEMISTSAIRITCMVRAGAVEQAVQVLHNAFDWVIVVGPTHLGLAPGSPAGPAAHRRVLPYTGTP